MQAMRIPRACRSVIVAGYPFLIEQLIFLIGACGAIVPPESVDDWICELCQNEETQEASLVLCYLISVSSPLTSTSRMLNVSYVPANQKASSGKPHREALHQTRFFTRARRRRGRAGHMFCVLSSFLNLLLRMRLVFDVLKASA